MALQTEGSRTGDVVVLRIAGRVDGDTAPELDQACQQWLAPTDRVFILDFSEVSYISSAGLSCVLKAGKGIGNQGGRLLICGLNPHLKRLFVFSGFDALFPLLETREAALEAAQSQSADGSPIRP